MQKCQRKKERGEGIDMKKRPREGVTLRQLEKKVDE
jgi:hypothetical protein